jgi:hypothetical protein
MASAALHGRRQAADRPRRPGWLAPLLFLIGYFVVLYVLVAVVLWVL